MLKAGDIIRIGRVNFKINEISNEKEAEDLEVLDDQESVCSDANPDRLICRICLSS